MKSICTITPAITEDMECLIVWAHVPVIDQNSGCAAQRFTQLQYITMLRFHL